MSQPHGFGDKVAFVWRVADKLRGTFRPHEYGQVMLPLLVLRRLDAVLEPTKAQVLAKAAQLESAGMAPAGIDKVLQSVSGYPFYNTSPLSFGDLLADDKNVLDTTLAYIAGFSPGATEVMEAYDLYPRLKRMDKAQILYPVLADFADLDVRPQTVGNEAMGYMFEELLRKFSEMSNETAGEHYTPREIIRLMVNLLLDADEEALTSPAPVRTVYDPAAGTGGMLTVAADRIAELNPQAQVQVFGQELNPETWAVARSDLMIKGSDPGHILLGNSLADDGFPADRFDYLLANPPYGVDWKAYRQPIEDEHRRSGFAGRFGPGLPRVSDGSLLFLLHMIAKMKPVADDPGTPWVDGGSRIGIVLSGSPLFSGGAGSGESEIRRWILESDLLEGIVALPDQMFYNTGINTYVWVLTNRKAPEAAGLVRLVDARELGTKMRKSLGDKRKELSDAAVDEVTRLYSDALDDPDNDVGDGTGAGRVKAMANVEFGYARLTVEQPLRRAWAVTDDTLAALPSQDTRAALAGLTGQSWASAAAAKKAIKAHAPSLDTKTLNQVVKTIGVHDPDAPAVAAKRGGLEPDPELRDQENIPLPADYLGLASEEDRAEAVRQAAEAHLAAEIHPYLPDAWIDHDKTRIGYEIPFTRQFYTYTPPRPVAEIRADITALEARIQNWMKGLAG
ncbi:MAG: SAM-dependent DNA methyltransferase [Actinobacteria bacterium]|nr:MAG: SAM-dependent DNA methyltransferase [Actinomycetota bacterium]